MSYCLNSLTRGGVYIGDYIGDYYRGYRGPTRSLDCRSYSFLSPRRGTRGLRIIYCKFYCEELFDSIGCSRGSIREPVRLHGV